MFGISCHAWKDAINRWVLLRWLRLKFADPTCPLIPCQVWHNFQNLFNFNTSCILDLLLKRTVQLFQQNNWTVVFKLCQSNWSEFDWQDQFLIFLNFLIFIHTYRFCVCKLYCFSQLKIANEDALTEQKSGSFPFESNFFPNHWSEAT